VTWLGLVETYDQHMQGFGGLQCPQVAHLRHVGMSVVSPLLNENRTRTEIAKAANRAAGGAYNAVRLSSASMTEPTVFNVHTTVQQALTDASLSDQRRHESRCLLGEPKPGRHQAVTAKTAKRGDATAPAFMA